MSDVTAGSGGGMAMPSRGQMGALLNRPDLFLAIGVMGILVVLLVTEYLSIRKRNAESRW